LIDRYGKVLVKYVSELLAVECRKGQASVGRGNDAMMASMKDSSMEHSTQQQRWRWHLSVQRRYLHLRVM